MGVYKRIFVKKNHTVSVLISQLNLGYAFSSAYWEMKSRIGFKMTINFSSANWEMESGIDLKRWRNVDRCLLLAPLESLNTPPPSYNTSLNNTAFPWNRFCFFTLCWGLSEPRQNPPLSFELLSESRLALKRCLIVETLARRRNEICGKIERNWFLERSLYILFLKKLVSIRSQIYSGSSQPRTMEHLVACGIYWIQVSILMSLRLSPTES